MNPSRAKENFSAYREGTLDAALRMAFERTLQSDAQLQAEYRAFERSMEDLECLKSEEIEAPIWLSDRIATRLEAAQAGRNKAPIWWSGWFRNFALGGLAVAAIGGAVVGIVSRDVKGPAVGPMIYIPTSGGDAKIQYKVVGDHLEATSAATVTVSSGDVVSKFGGRAKGDLQNPNPNPATFSLQVDGKEFEVVVLPGTDPADASKLRSEGTLVQFAEIFSAVARKPIRLPASEKEKRVSWDFSGSDPFADASRSLQSASLGVDQRESGEIALSSNG